MAKNIKIIQACFNIVDPYQRKQWEYVKGQTNSSGYIRRLVQRDMEQTTARRDQHVRS